MCEVGLNTFMKGVLLKKAGSLLAVVGHFPTLSPVHTVTQVEAVCPETSSYNWVSPLGCFMHAQ